MRRTTKRILTLLLSALILMASVPVSAASTAGNPWFSSSVKRKAGNYYSVPTGKAVLTYYPKNESYTNMDVSSDQWEGTWQMYTIKKNRYYLGTCPKVSEIKSSDPSVATVSTKSDEDDSEVYVTVKKAGTTTITFTYEDYDYDYDAGEVTREYTVTRSVTVTVKKYVNPFKSLKIGSKKVSTKTLKKTSVCSLKYNSLKNKKAKVSFKLASGWKINKTYSTCFTAKRAYKGSLKNGFKTKVTGGKGFTYNFRLVNSKTGQYEDVEVVLK